MSKSKENKLVPKLRFPEFKDSGEWEVKEIHKLSEIIKGQQLNKLELSETGTYPCLNGGINPSGYAEKYNSDSDTITISEGGNSCGYVNYMTSKFWLGGHCYKLLPKQGVNKLFYYHLLKHNESRIMKLRVGSGLPNIQQKSLREFKVQYISNPQEQQKIADCLSSLDELITAESKKLEVLKEHKKGLLQQLFPQEGETVPKLRFPEFVNSGEWEVKEIHKLSEIIKGQQLNKLELSETGTYPCLNGGINPSGYAEKYNSDSDTITISEGGNSCGYVNYMTSKFWLGGHCYKLLPKQGVNKLFYYHLLKHNESRIMKLRVGSGLPNIQQKSLREFKVQYISNPQEQQKIADCLSSLDELITAQSQKIEALKQHKKGLLQGLFPNLNQAEE
jgi:type I restriction enzyme S subunit